MFLYLEWFYSFRMRSTKRQLEVMANYMATNTRFANNDYDRGTQGREDSVREWQRLRLLLADYGPDKSIVQWQIVSMFSVSEDNLPNTSVSNISGMSKVEIVAFSCLFTNIHTRIIFVSSQTDCSNTYVYKTGHVND